MNEKYKHQYYNEKNYIVLEVWPGGGRIIDKPEQYAPYLKWCETNTPEKISGDRFVSIVNNAVVIDPQKETILAQEDQLRKDMKLREEIAASD